MDISHSMMEDNVPSKMNTSKATKRTNLTIWKIIFDALSPILRSKTIEDNLLNVSYCLLPLE